MNIPHHGPSPQERLSRVLVTLMKGLVHRESNPALWQDLLQVQAAARDYLAVLALDLRLDEAEGYAWLCNRQSDEEHQDQQEKNAPESSPLPRLIARRPLSYPVSLLLALLRKKLAESDSQGSDSRLILSREEVAEMLLVFLPETGNQAKLLDQIDSHINKVVDLGFARRLKGQENLIEVSRIIKSFVDAQWLSDFDTRLEEYRKGQRHG